VQIVDSRGRAAHRQ